MIVFRPNQRWGVCKIPATCLPGMAFYPQDSKCYSLHSRGPCSKGKLLSIGNDNIAQCNCENEGILSQYYFKSSDTCHEHFTKGPCHGAGQLFLPDGKCGCHLQLPHYHEPTDQCYEIGEYFFFCFCINL